MNEQPTSKEQLEKDFMQWVRDNHHCYSQDTNGNINLSKSRVLELFVKARAADEPKAMQRELEEMQNAYAGAVQAIEVLKRENEELRSAQPPTAQRFIEQQVYEAFGVPHPHEITGEAPVVVAALCPTCGHDMLAAKPPAARMRFKEWWPKYLADHPLINPDSAYEESIALTAWTAARHTEPPTPNADEGVSIQPVTIADESDAHVVKFKVGPQEFFIGREFCENREHAEWFADMFRKALRTWAAGRSVMKECCMVDPHVSICGRHLECGHCGTVHSNPRTETGTPQHIIEALNKHDAAEITHAAAALGTPARPDAYRVDYDFDGVTTFFVTAAGALEASIASLRVGATNVRKTPLYGRTALEPLAGGVPIDEYIAELEKDPQLKAALDKARAIRCGAVSDNGSPCELAPGHNGLHDWEDWG